jgi:hypothetical protein
VEDIDWRKVHADLDAQGWAVVPQLLTLAEAESIAGLYHQEQGFRSQVMMGRYGFGRGEYKYFSYPLPPLIQELRTAAYPHLAPIANQWHERMDKEVRFPEQPCGVPRALPPGGAGSSNAAAPGIRAGRL